jgi:adenine-specific DNA-methyltransferase
MANNISAIDQLKGFLNELFQFDSQDLDFGVYKILHYKRNEIKDFIEILLTDKVKEQLKTLTTEEAEKLKEELADLEKDGIVEAWLKADETERKTLEKFGKDKIREYLKVKGEVTGLRVSAETENQIYNHLTLFFSRYYDKGDFISKRRFGKNEKYVVPYNGEETHFHWANHDQYYIKSSETFQQYAFKIPIAKGSMVVNFKLTAAQMEQGNVKADEPNYFMLSEKEAEIGADESTFFFEYRPLNDEEKQQIKGNNKQDAIDELTFEQIKANCGKTASLAELWKTDKDGKALLLKKLHHYTRKNKYDFFIHKNLKGFLQRELDYYIKSELIAVDDLYVSETEGYFDSLKHRIKTIKVFKSIADVIIDFVSQIEEFQKKLWEKKKFVLSTEWVITIDRLVEYIGEEAAKPFLEEVIKNERQVAEWRELFGKEIIKDWNNIQFGDLAPVQEKNRQLGLTQSPQDEKEWLKLPIDTIHLTPDFKIHLLYVLSENINLEIALDGLVIHSDNYHGLQTLSSKFRASVNGIYIDPPYNTSASEIIYKNSFKHSSWLSLMESRIEPSKDYLKSDGIICVTIDDFEYFRLKGILENTFGDHLGTIPIRNNPSGRSTAKGVSIAHEYALFYSHSEDSKASVGRLERSEKQKNRYSEKDNNGFFEWVNFRKHGGFKEESPKMYYPFFATRETFRIPNIEWNDESKEWILLEKPKGEEIIIYPVDEDGNLRRWKWGIERTRKYLKSDFKVSLDKNKELGIYMKARLNNEGILPLTWWDSKLYSATAYGTNLLNDIFLKPGSFSYPKSIYAVADSIQTMNVPDNGLVLDYFPGSGTTFHATQFLNQQDSGDRKCVLIEQGGYIYSVIIPRIKKIAYTFDWKDGCPKDGSMNGLGVFFKYQRLEQYEEALENIAFTAPAGATQMALKLDSYIPKYFLEFETKGSQTLVNTAAMHDPWDYKLKVWDGFTYDTEQAVDLVETFNYLIGLHMQKCITKELHGRKYQFVYGNNNANKNILVVWRSVKDWKIDDYKADSEVLKEELANYQYDLLYINDQAHIEDYQPIEEVFKNKMLS